MSTITRSITHATGLVLAAMTLACSEQALPSAPDVPGPVLATAPATVQLSAELRGVRHRGEQPSLAKGDLQLRLTQSIGDPNLYLAAWQGSVQNPRRERFVAGSIAYIGDPDLLPADLLAELAGIALIGDPNVAQRFSFSGAQPISDRLADAMFEHPEGFLVTLYTSEHPGGAIGGVFTGDGSV